MTCGKGTFFKKNIRKRQIMITCIIGTRAQLVKMAPVIREIELRKLPFQILMTGQHKETMQTLLDDFGIKTIPKNLEPPEEVSSIPRMLFWFPRVFIKMLWNRDMFKGDSKQTSWILVHGDTLSTLLGAIVGKFTPCKVAHIESGLRSYHFFSPFPEEITRLLTFYLADIGFCPGQWAVDNLKKFPIKAVNTQANTIIDSVKYAIKHKPRDLNIPEKKYAVVSIHRFENIYNQARFTEIIEAVERISQHYSLLFVLHPATKKRLNKLNLMGQLTSNENIKLIPRMGYISFINLVSNSLFVVTDGGSNQEELSYLRVPTLLMRDATERPEGIGETAFLEGYKLNVVKEFLQHISDGTFRGEVELSKQYSPSKVMVNYLGSTTID